MSVNSVLKEFFSRRLTIAVGVAVMMFTLFLFASSFTSRSQRDLLAKQANLTIRDIGHRLLLQAGDSTSRVLPVMEVSDGVFLLTFENEFVFNHDTLVALSRRLLSQSKLPSDYTVTVHECLREAIVYGFQISKTSPNLIACSGRNQPAGCYTIQIAFANFSKSKIDYSFFILVCTATMGLLCVAISITWFKKSTTPVVNHGQYQPLIKEALHELPRLGKFYFDIKVQRLLFNNEIISLTEKECRILELLYESFGQLMSREILMQEVWINEGVITGRSLDMFVSKLRKKLSRDPGLRIMNVHGKGYKLEIVGDETANGEMQI
jgi:DNA-binding winged helix-turn-helix (wHTH) protein